MQRVTLAPDLKTIARLEGIAIIVGPAAETIASPCHASRSENSYFPAVTVLGRINGSIAFGVPVAVIEDIEYILGWIPLSGVHPDGIQSDIRSDGESVVRLISCAGAIGLCVPAEERIVVCIIVDYLFAQGCHGIEHRNLRPRYVVGEVVGG